jgi:hypothetical protein
MNLGVERTIMVERPTPEYTGYDMCVTLDAADVCYTGSFTGNFEWSLSIIISEQPNLRLPIKLPKFPNTGRLDEFKKSNTCMKIKKPQICFEDYNPFVASDELELKLTTESISFRRIESSSSIARRIGRYFSSGYGVHYGNVNGQLCLSWVSDESSTFYGKTWHSAFQYTKGAEVPYNWGDGLILYNSSVNNMETCIPIKEKMISIFSEHPEDVTLWELSKPLTFSVTHVPKSLEKNEYEGYVDGNSRNVDYDTATCFTNVKTNVCMVNSENAVESSSYMASINVNAQGAKPWEGSSKSQEPSACIPSTINKLCLNLEDVISTNDNSLEKQEPHVTNTMYFVSSDKVRNKSNKFFCKKIDEANFCINSKTTTFYDNNLISSIQFHPSGLSPRVNASSGIYDDDIHKCLKSCAFEACFTSNDNGLPWILASTMYFTKM